MSDKFVLTLSFHFNFLLIPLMRFNFLLIFFSFIISSSVQASNEVILADTNFSTQSAESSLLSPDSTWKLKRNPPVALSLVVANNVFVWAFDRYVLDADYARINFTTMKNNIKNGFEWDNDLFSTNLIAHPYHGGLYFTAARANGIGFWGSIPYAVAGSAMWEFLMENKYPSINDFVATTIGGVGFGEMLFRLSDVFVDDRTTGGDRIAREIGIFALTPMRGLTRLVTGNAFRHREVRGNQFPEIPKETTFAAGYRMLEERTEGKIDIGNMMAFDMTFRYGTPFQSMTNQPYDYFTFNLSANLNRAQPLISRFSLLGKISAREIEFKSLKHGLAVGLFQHFNFYQTNANVENATQAFKLSETASIGIGALYRYYQSLYSTFHVSSHLTGIIMGGSQTDYYRIDNRDYNLGSGFSGKFNASWIYRKLKLGLEFEDYRLFTLVGNNPGKPEEFKEGMQGDVSRSALSIAYLHVNYRIGKSLFLSGEANFQHRKTDYKYYPSMTHRIFGQRISLGVTM